MAIRATEPGTSFRTHDVVNQVPPLPTRAPREYTIRAPSSSGTGTGADSVAHKSGASGRVVSIMQRL